MHRIDIPGAQKRGTGGTLSAVWNRHWHWGHPPKWMQTVITTFDVKTDPAKHQVDCVFHFAKAAQGGR